MSKTKTATHDVLLDLYQRAGLQVTLSVARDLLKSDVRGKIRKSKIAEFKTEMNGELSEVVLEILIMDYCAMHARQTKDWFWYKSLILRDPGGSADFLTELDFTLFTPECIYIFECKSYSGKKRLSGDGMLERQSGNSCNVYKQNLLHVRTLDKNLKHSVKKPIYRMVMFNFSSGDLVDTRADHAKFVMPCVGAEDWESVLVKGAPVWNLGAIKPFTDKLAKDSERLRERHLKYVKSIERYEDG